ncbi:hypothetical protein JW848_02140 [Candidatus Bipolaricaulota bacterium]|nr:hypothetical protein [Candidatus Bipolaricaulota bacterium]
MMGRVICLLLVGVLAIGAACLAVPVIVEQVLDSEPGFGLYLWFDDDFGWTHTLEDGVSPTWLFGAATLTIKANDVDSPREQDLIYADGGLLGALFGSTGTTTETTFTIADLASLVGDRAVSIFLDIDSTNGNWAVTILESVLRYRYMLPRAHVDIESLDAPVGAGGATGAPGGEVQIAILNSGAATYIGPCEVFAGLAYTTSWLPEAVTIFDTFDAGIVELVPGVPLTLTFPLAAVPPALLDLFHTRLADVWTGYEDDDPRDYVGFFVRFDGLPTVVDYLPLP